MKKIILGFFTLAAVLTACNNKDDKSTNSSAGSIKLPYEAGYTTDFNNKVSDSDYAVRWWRSNGGNPIYTRYQTGGHVPTQAYNTPGLVDWVMAQKRGVASTNEPILHIASPTPDDFYATGASNLTLTGWAAALGQEITQVTWQNLANNATNAAVGTTNWAALDIPLESDMTNVIIVTGTTTSWAKSLKGNTTFSSVLTVISSPIRATISSQFGAVFLNWTGGVPPFRVQKTSDVGSEPWKDVQADVVPPMWLPGDRKQQFFRVVGAQ